VEEPSLCPGCDQPLLADGNCPDAGNCPVGARMKAIWLGAQGNAKLLAERNRTSNIQRSTLNLGSDSRGVATAEGGEKLAGGHQQQQATAKERMEANRRVLPPGDRE
jgi:hypothetical protein